jgi:NTP pyrophosphatase (non-canonical NTP hydrolase)
MSANLWPVVGSIVAALDKTNGRSPHENAARVLKVTEEAGEAAAAYIGAVGQNPRKGFTHGPDDVADELADVIIAAAVAMHSFDDDPATVLTAKLRKAAERLNIPCVCDDFGDGPCPRHPDPDH